MRLRRHLTTLRRLVPDLRGRYVGTAASAPAARKPDPEVFVGLASIPDRVDSLRTVVRSLLPQAGRIGVYLNGYATVPAFLKHPRIDVARSQEHGDVRDNGKFFFLSRVENRFYAAVDDDIQYPPDYISRLRNLLGQAPVGSAVGVHGSIYPRNILGLLGPRHLIHFSHASAYVLPVHVLGTGTVLFDQRLWNLRYEEFGTPGMADVWFARAALDRNASMFVINRDRYWLSALADDTRALDEAASTLYSEAKHNDELQVRLLSERGVSARALEGMVTSLASGDSFAENFTVGQALALNDIRLKLGWPRLDAHAADRLRTRIRGARGDWTVDDQLGETLQDSHAAAIAGVLSGDVTAATALSAVNLLEKCAKLADTDRLRWRSLPAALRFDSRAARLRRIRSTLSTLGVQRSPDDARILWPVAEASPTLALEAERAGVETNFEQHPSLPRVARKNPLNAARLLSEFLEIRQWSHVPDTDAWQRIFGASYDRKEVQMLLAVAMSRAGRSGAARALTARLRHRWPGDPETRLVDTLAFSPRAGHDAFLDCLAPLDALLDDVGLQGFGEYVEPNSAPSAHWMDRFAAHPTQPTQTGLPKVSVIMTVYNSAETVRQAISSVLMSEGVSVELIVVDDASTDTTREIVGSIADDRVRLLTNPTNVGPYMSRNRGLQVITGDFVTFADADDWSHPQRLMYQVARLQEDPEILGCTVAHVRFRPDGLADLENHLQFMGHGPVTLLMRRDVVEQIGGFDHVRTRGDIEFIGRFRARFGSAALIAFGAPLVLATSSQMSNSKQYDGSALQRYRTAARRWHQDATRNGVTLFVNVSGTERAPFIAPEELTVK